MLRMIRFLVANSRKLVGGPSRALTREGKKRLRREGKAKKEGKG